MNSFMTRIARVIQDPNFIPHLQKAGLIAGFVDYAGSDGNTMGDEEVFNALVDYLSNPKNVHKLHEFDGLLLTGLPDVDFVEIIEDIARLVKAVADIAEAIKRLISCCSDGKSSLQILKMRRYLQ
jgi:hypothetical protein